MKFRLNLLIISCILISAYSIHLRYEKYSFMNGTIASLNNTNTSSTNTTNSIGFTNSTRLTGSPYQIKSCDQVLEIEGNRILDIKDYTKREPAFFTMNVYFINMFKTKDGNTLIESIPMNKIKIKPEILNGSHSCIHFTVSIDKHIEMCMKNKEAAIQLLDAYNNFLKCRAGDNLALKDPAKLNSMLKASCLGLNVNFDINKFGEDVNKASAALDSAISDALMNVSKKLKFDLNNTANNNTASAEKQVMK